MAMCRDQEIPIEAHTHAMALRERCAAYGLEKGMISEEILDALGIYSTPGSISRDKLTECRQNAFLVTHNDSIGRHNESIRNSSKVHISRHESDRRTKAT